ncbi:MAG: phenylacetate--CoA ligase family protein [Christensenellales bacterium]
MFYDEKIETMSRAELNELQLERLKKAVKYAYENSAFYTKMFDNAKIKPEDIKSLDDLRKIPFTVKSDLRDNYPFGLNAVPMDGIARIHASSGTSGKPTVVTYTKNDLEMWSECMARIVTMAGVTSKDVVQISFGYGLFTGALGLHQGMEKVGAAVIPASSGNTERQVMLLKDLGATVLVATPSYALYIGEMIEKLGLDIKDFKLRLGLFGSEASSVEMHKEIEKKLNIVSTDNYGLSEIIGPGVAGECSYKDGLHVNEDYFLIEILDPKTFEPVPDGEYGELVITALCKEAMPILRYRTKDITRIIPGICKCGRTFRRLDKFQGRTDDMLVIRGVNVFPSQIEGVLMEIPEVGGQYEIVVTRENYMDKLEVSVEVADSGLLDNYGKLEALRSKIKHNLKTVLQIEAVVKLVEPLSLKRYEGKAKRVTDLRKF